MYSVVDIILREMIDENQVHQQGRVTNEEMYACVGHVGIRFCLRWGGAKS